MNTISCVITLSFAIALAGCGEVRESSHIVATRTGTPLVAAVGDTVLQIKREKNLPNIVGRADIFGRTTPTGLESVQYLGVRDGKAFFRRHSVGVETGATTMNSTPIVIPNTATTTQSGVIIGSGVATYHGTSTTVLPPTVIPPHPPAPVVMDEGSLVVAVDLATKPARLSVAGKTVTILKADAAKLVYVLSE
jgi:hypothetical protein